MLRLRSTATAESCKDARLKCRDATETEALGNRERKFAVHVGPARPRHLSPPLEGFGLHASIAWSPHLLRFRFAPRVRDLADRRLYVADGGATYAALAGGAWAPFARGQRISRIVHPASACSEIRVRRRRRPPLFADCRSAERTAAFGWSVHANPRPPVTGAPLSRLLFTNWGFVAPRSRSRAFRLRLPIALSRRRRLWRCPLRLGRRDRAGHC